MTVLALALKDLRRVWSDRRALAVSLVLPLLLTFVMGLSFGGGVFGGGGLSDVPIVLVGDGVPDFLRSRLLEALAETGFFAASWADSATADRLVRRGEAAAAVVLPTDFWNRFLGDREVPIGLWKDPGSPLRAGIVEQVLERLLAGTQAGEAAHAALWPEDAFDPDAPGPGGRPWSEYFEGGVGQLWRRWRDLEGDPALGEARSKLMGRLDHQAALGEALSAGRVTLQVADLAPAPAAPGPDANLFNYFLPSFSIFFLMFGVAAGARDWHRERVRGTLQRQWLSPVGGLRILAGKWLAASLQGMVQLLLLLLAGALLFRVNLGPDLWSLPLLVILTGTAAAGLFLLLALLTRTEKMMDTVSTTVILISALLGGNMMPVDLLPGWIGAAGRFCFNYWANRGFSDVIAGDRSLAEHPAPALVLAAFGLVMAGLLPAVLAWRRRRGGPA